MPTDLAEELSRYLGTSSTSKWLTIDSDHLREFAHSTYLDAASVDTTISKNNVLGPDLVDGFMLLSILMHVEFADPLSNRVGLYGFNYGLDRVRFTNPVFVGQRVRYHRTVVNVETRTPTRSIITSEHSVETDDGSTAMHAIWKTMLIDGPNEAE